MTRFYSDSAVVFDRAKTKSYIPVVLYFTQVNLPHGSELIKRSYFITVKTSVE